jgi:hypothetical protein
MRRRPGMSWTSNWKVAVVLGVIAFGGWGLLIKRNLPETFSRSRILKEGITAIGVVAEKGAEGGGRMAQAHVGVRYQDRGGRSHRKDFVLPKEDFARLQIGQEMPLHYLPESPDEAVLDEYDNSIDTSMLLWLGAIVIASTALQLWVAKVKRGALF